MSKVQPFDPRVDVISGTDLKSLGQLVAPWLEVEWLEADWVSGATDAVCGVGIRLIPKHRSFVVRAEGDLPIPPQLAAEARRVSRMYENLADWLETLPDKVTDWELTDE